MNWKNVPIPERMQHLPRDRRGYPIPFIVFRDRDDRPHFTINDQGKSLHCLKHDLCPISGTPLNRFRWFVGGPLSAFHEQGAYLDLPMHKECMEYALQVCPYLAAPHYGKRIDEATLSPEKAEQTTILADPTVIENRPGVFVAVMTTGQHKHPDGMGGYRLRPKRPYREVAFWQHGVRLDDEEGRRLSEEALQRPIPELQAPKLRFVTV